MMIPRLPLCLINFHQPRRSRINWDDRRYTYTSECRNCGKPIHQLGPRHWLGDDKSARNQIDVPVICVASTSLPHHHNSSCLIALSRQT